MAEDKANTEVKHPQAPPPFVEVECRSLGKVLRFSSGTEAGFAVNLINKRLLNDNDSDGVQNVTLVSHIEAVKEGEEEPVSFGPNSVLVKYGPDWKLQTVVHSYGAKGVHIEPTRVRKVSAKGDLELGVWECAGRTVDHHSKRLAVVTVMCTVSLLDEWISIIASRPDHKDKIGYSSQD